MTQSWNDDSSTAQTAKGEAGHVASHATDQASQVAGTAKEQATQVAHEAADQARNLLGEARSQLDEQAGAQKERASGGLRTIADELRSMGNGESPATSGIGSELVGQASQHVERVADWLESTDAQGALDDVRRWARRNPGTFLLVAAGAGMLAGRLTRATTQAVRSDSQSQDLSTPYATPPATGDMSETTSLTPPVAAPSTVPTTGYSSGYQSTGYTPPSTYGSGDEGTDPTGAPSTYGQEPLR